MTMPPTDPADAVPEDAVPALGRLVRGEAGRRAAESRLQADPARLAAGWQRRFVIEGARVPECLQLYESMGLEVVADPVRAEDVLGECRDCRVVAMLDFRMIYTRVRRSGPV